MIRDIWKSARALPLWVQVWVFVILVPVNLLALAFVGQPGGLTVGLLAVAGIAPNVVLMLANRGFSKAMALSHLIFWLPLLIVIALALAGEDLAKQYRLFLMTLAAVDLVSVAFDLRDARDWLRGDRRVAGR